MIHPMHLPLAMAYIQKLLTTGNTHEQMEYLAMHSNGEYCWYQGGGKILKAADGQVTGFIGSSRNIHQEKLAKKAQQESAELLAKLSEQVPGAIYQFRRKPDGSFDFPYVSKGITSILPVTPQECMQDIMAFFGYVHPDDLNPLMHSIQQSYENQSEWQQEYRVICTEKGLRWMRGHSQPELQPDGSTIWHGFLEDVTTNKQAEEVLAQTSQQLSSIFTAMSDVVWALSMPDNKPLFITPSVEALYGITHHEFMTDETYWHRVIHPDDMWAKESILSDLAQHGQFACEYRIITASQQVKWVLNRGRTIYDEQGQAIRVDGMISDITTRKNMEIALQHTSEMLEETSKLAKIGGWSYDPAINVVYWSDITKEIHEVSADYQPDPDKAVEFYKEGYYRNRIMACLKACVEHGTPYDEECLFITAKGREIWVRSVGKAEFKNGRCVRLYGTFQDIDDRKRAEIAYRRAKELLEQTGSTAKVGGWEYDFMHKKIYWTNSLKEIHEVGRDFEPSSSYHALLQQFYPEPGQIEKIKEILQQSLLKQEPYDHELLLTTAKGRKKWIRALGKPVFEQGKCIRMFGTVQDIDDRKHAEAEMRMLESVVKHTKDSVLITEAEPFDLPGPKIVYVNEAFSRMTGYTPEEIIGKTPRILQGPKSDRETLKRVREALRNWESFEVELINYKKNGEEYWVNFSVVPVADRTGWYTHWIAIERDITEQKHNEERLIQAKEQAEAANRAKSEFLANMSHEIRTPLNSVIGFTDLLVRTRLDDVQRQYMQTVHQSANSLLDLINDILDFSKIEAGKLELSLEKTDLWDLASQVADIVKFKTAEKKLELLLNISPHLPRFAWVDPVRLRQILVNLLSNAVKFTHEGEIEIGIALLPAKQKDKASIEFSVRDTGIGIAPDKQDKIFEAFTQEDTSTTRKYGGTGLGLTISNKLLLLMDSKLELHSTQTEGSRFFFHLEVTTEEGVPENWEVLRQLGKVLIVDDNENNCRILQEMLALQGIASDTANSGLLALDMVMRRSGYGVAIVDYHMPLIDGLEVIEKIRKKLNITAAQLPIVLLHSAADDQHINAACREFQVHAQLNKPITLKRLFQTLARLFDQNVLQEAQVPEQPKLCTDAQYTVLVADDNEFNRMLAKNMIFQLLPGATVIEAANGKEAVEKYHALAPDLILMDIQMPEMSGYEAASEIRKAHGRRVPIIALTAGTVKGEKERCLEAGMDDYLSKPIVLDRLHMALLEWLAPENQGIPTERQGTQAASKEKLRFNRSSLLKRLGNNEEVLAEIMVLFREKILVQMPLQVEEALQEGKTVKEIRSIAHSIKGASQGAGFEILAALAAKLEYMEPWDHSHALLLLDSIKVEIVAIKEVIEKAE
jgi:PAS domain S-box-containing protein